MKVLSHKIKIQINILINKNNSNNNTYNNINNINNNNNNKNNNNNSYKMESQIYL